MYYGYGYMVGALPRGRCARSMAGFADTRYLLTMGRCMWSAPGYCYRGWCAVCVPRAGTRAGCRGSPRRVTWCVVLGKPRCTALRFLPLFSFRSCVSMLSVTLTMVLGPMSAARSTFLLSLPPQALAQHLAIHIAL